MVTAEWPPYPIGPRDSIFAVGVTATRFAELESVLRFIFGTVFQLGFDDSTMLASKMGNEATMFLVRQKSASLDSIAKDHILHFLKGFDACKEARDHLMHSGLAWAGGTDHNYFYKTTKQGQTVGAAPTLKQLREVADDIVRYVEYGRMLGNAITNSCFEEVPIFPVSAFPWPDKPSAPTQLAFSADPIVNRRESA